MTHDDAITVDLSDEDAEEPRDHPEDTEALEEDPDEPSATDPATQAKRFLDSANGRDEYERATSALGDIEEAAQEHEQSIRQVKQRLSEIDRQTQEKERRIERLENTIERLEELPDDSLCLQNLSGGVTAEVPPASETDERYNRDDLVADVEESIDAYEEQIENLEAAREKFETQTDSMETEMGVLEQAHHRLQSHREMLE